MKKYVVIIAIAAVHSVVTKVIANITLAMVSAHAHSDQMSVMGRLFMAASKVLYFPVITLAWYPRQFFPGNWVLIPLFVNSLLWAVMIYLFFILLKSVFVSNK
ncbi:MAG: hypothetical protein JSW04_01565 [Desulfobacterales bacterium]|nr:MAG: hypothetical protein JSV38_12115 [Desulfobacterales bacterium]UCD90156.1 MAG: hypothetical protein JSW04_01565 [Desulfobacterales bacterium]